MAMPAKAQEDVKAQESILGSRLDSLYIVPMLTYTKASGQRNADDAMGGELLFGIPVTDNTRFELGVFYEKFDGTKDYLGNPHEDFQVEGVSFGLTQPVVDVGLYRVFVDGRLLWTHNDDKVDSYDAGAFSMSIGFERPLPLFGLSLRAEVGLRQILSSSSGPHDSDYGEWQGRIGLMRTLEWRHPPTPKTPGDQDRDGVPDERDACPDTPLDDAVDEHGCTVRDFVLVYFPLGSDELTMAARQQLDRIAQTAGGARSADGKRHPAVVAVFAGPPAPGVAAQAVDELNARRLQKVSDYLQSRGIEAAMVEGPERKGTILTRMRGPQPVVELRIINPQ